MLEWPGIMFPLWLMLLLEPAKPDTARVEKKIEYVNVNCTIVKKQPTIVFDSCAIYTYETECKEIITLCEIHNEGDIIIRRKKKGAHP
jgi:hypothetical protein